MPAVIESRALQKRYGAHVAVDQIDLRIERGSVVGLVGPNGAGKTTVLRMLVDIIRPTSGELTVLGEVPSRAGAHLRRRIGYLPGELKLTGRSRGEQLLDYLARISGPVAPGMVAALAERLDLDLQRPVRALSKGNRQKLGLVQAFMHQPELLILDEPTSGLDPLVQREFLELVQEAREAGQTVLLSSHILSELQHAADHVAVLAGGKLVAQGEISSLRLASVTRVRALLEATDVATVRAALPTLANAEIAPANESTLVRVSGTIHGGVDALVKALARFTVRQLTLEEPDLEESILTLYAHPAGTEPTDGTA